MARLILTRVFVAVFLCGTINAQRAQTVQLPTFEQFSIGTTVSVPVRGSAAIGGVSGIRSSGAKRSVPVFGRVPGVARTFQNRSFGQQAAATQSSVSVTVLDLDEMDRTVRAEARQMKGDSRNDPIVARARFLTQHVGRASENRHLWLASTDAPERPSPSTFRDAVTSPKRKASGPRPLDPPLVLDNRNRRSRSH